MSVSARRKTQDSWLDPESAGLLGWKLAKRLTARIEGHEGRFITLTYDRKNFSDAQDCFDRARAEKHVSRYMKKLGKLLGRDLKGQFITKMEFQEGGWLHWHILLLDVGFMQPGVLTQARQLWGRGFVHFKPLNEANVKYLTKYVAKDGTVPGWLYGYPARSIKVVRPSQGFWNDEKAAKAREMKAKRKAVIAEEFEAKVAKVMEECEEEVATCPGDAERRIRQTYAKIIEAMHESRADWMAAREQSRKQRAEWNDRSAGEDSEWYMPIGEKLKLQRGQVMCRVGEKYFTIKGCANRFFAALSKYCGSPRDEGSWRTYEASPQQLELAVAESRRDASTGPQRPASEDPSEADPPLFLRGTGNRVGWWKVRWHGKWFMLSPEDIAGKLAKWWAKNAPDWLRLSWEQEARYERGMDMHGNWGWPPDAVSTPG